MFQVISILIGRKTLILYLYGYFLNFSFGVCACCSVFLASSCPLILCSCQVHMMLCMMYCCLYLLALYAVVCAQ